MRASSRIRALGNCFFFLQRRCLLFSTGACSYASHDTTMGYLSTDIQTLALLWAAVLLPAAAFTPLLYLLTALLAITTAHSFYTRSQLGPVSPPSVALCTGATSGIGAAIAEDLGRRGFRLVVVSGASKEAATQFAEKLKADGFDVRP